MKDQMLPALRTSFKLLESLFPYYSGLTYNYLSIPRYEKKEIES